MTDMEVLMIEALKNLTKSEFISLKKRLTINCGDRKNIPLSELDDMTDDIDVIRKITSYYYPKQVQVLIDMLKDINKNDLAEKLRNQVETEERKSDNQIDSDGSPAKMQKLCGTASYDGKYNLSDLVDYASKNQDQLIKQLEEYLEHNGMRILKEKLVHSKLKNFVFSAKQCYELQSNKDLRKILTAQRSQNIPEKILAILFSTSKSTNKSALDKKRRKDNSESKNQCNKLPSNKWKGSTPVSPNASHLGLNDNDGENLPKSEYANLTNTNYTELNDRGREEKVPEPVNEKTDEGVLDSSESTELNDRGGEEKVPVLVNEKTDEGVLSCLVHDVEETHSCESQVPKADNSLYDKTTRILCNKKEVENYVFDYVCVRKHEKYECFEVKDMMQFKLPGNTEYHLLQILQKKTDFTNAGNLTKNMEFELQFNMAVLGIPSSVVISLIKEDLFEIKTSNTFAQFELFFKDVVHKIVLPLLALYKMVQVERLQNALDKQRY